MSWDRRTGERAFINTDHPHGPRGHQDGSGPAAPGSLLALAGFVGMPLLVGVADAAVVQGNLRGWYASLTRPPGTPPDWIFGAVWTTLYILIGVSAWIVWRDSQRLSTPPAGDRHLRPLRFWGWQLLCNAAWAPAFFGLHSPELGLAILIVLLWLIVTTTLAFHRVRPVAAWLLIPYMAWACYATYLNAGFFWLNART